MARIWQWVTAAISALPKWLRRILATKTGQHLAAAAIMQMARHNPWLSTLGTPDDILAIIDGILDAGTAATLVSGTLFANDTLADLKAAGMPNHVVTPADPPTLQMIVVAGKQEAITMWKLNTKLELVFVLTDGREFVVPMGAMSHPQALLWNELSAKVKQ